MIRLSIQRPTTVAMAYVAIAAVGVASFLNIPVELLPDVDYPRLTVNAAWPGASPEVVEAFLTSPLEGAAQGVRGVHKVSSVSEEGSARLDIEFARGTDMDFARIELGERIGSIRDDLPPDVRPEVQPYVPREFQTGGGVDLRYTLSGSYTFERLRHYAEEQLRPALVAVDGVQEVAVHGGEEREVRVVLNRRRMEALGVRPAQVNDALEAATLVRTAGRLERGNTDWLVTVRNEVDAAAQLGGLVVSPDTAGTGRVVRVSDIADVQDAYADPTGYYRIDGRPAVSLAVVRSPGTNALRVADAAKARASELAASLPPGMRLTLERDGSLEIRKQLTDLRLRAAASAIVVFLVLLLFLGSFRSAGIVFATIAFSVLIAVNLLYFGGLSLNVLTLAGLAMGFGLIVDNSIVVLENVYRRWRGGEPPRAAAEAGTRQVALPIVAGTLTTVIVFVPFLYLQGELRLYYLPFAYAVGFSLLASLFVAFTFVPGLAARLLDRPGRSAPAGSLAAAASAPSDASPTALGGAAPTPTRALRQPIYVRAYRGVLGFALNHPVLVLTLTVASLYGSWRLFDKHVTKGAVWGRWGEETYISIYLTLPRGAELGRMNELARSFEAKLATMPEVERFTTNVTPEFTWMRVTFPDSLESTYVPVAIKDQMVAYSHLFGGADVRVYGFGPSFYGGGSSPPSYRLKILGYNYERTREIAEDLARRLKRFTRVRDVDTNADQPWRTDEASEFVLRIDRPKLAGYGLSVADLLGYVTRNLQGRVAADRIEVGGEEVEYALKLAGYQEFSFSDLRDLLVPTSTGERVRVSDVASVGRRDVLNRIIREDQQYQRYVRWEFRGPRKLGDLVRDRVLAATTLPPGYTIEKEEGFFWTQEEQQQITWVLVFAILLIYLVTAALFESLKAPFVVLLTVPLALIGVFLIFFYTGASFTRSAYIGVIMMAGIVVNNAILLVYHIGELRGGGAELRAAIVQGTLERVRPILMTTLTTVLGLLPLVLFSESLDATIWNALALATIGGLVASTLFVLTSLPVVYYLLERRSGPARAGSP